MTNSRQQPEQQPQEQTNEQDDHREFDYEGFAAACNAFLPLRELFYALHDIKETPRRRDDLDAIIGALTRFLRDVPIETDTGNPNSLALRRMSELVFALHDLNQGIDPALFHRQNPKENRSTATGEGIAQDLIIAAIGYRRQDGATVRMACDQVASDIRKQGVTQYGGKALNAGYIDSIERHHSRESNRKNNRPDLRARPISCADEYGKVIEHIGQLLKTGNQGKQ